MSSIVIVLGVLLLAIIFIIVELFLIPGISIAGLTGIALFGVAVWYAYNHLGATAGNLTLLGSFVLSGISVWAFIKMRVLEKMSLKTNVTGTVGKIDVELIKEGDTGITLSRLAPMGKVKINNIVTEAKTNDEFIDDGQEIVVLEVYNTNVLVMLKEKE